MSAPDYRILFPSTKVDFNNDVGTTGQDHDDYPSPDTQARYDWMRLYLIGLLSCQASEDQPTNYRTGTPWFSLAQMAYKYFDGSNFEHISKGILVPDDVTDEDSLGNLHDWAQAVTSKVDSITRRAVFSGEARSDSSVINMPASVQAVAAENDNRPFVYKNGKLQDPRLTDFNSGCPTCIELLGDAVLEEGDTFTVVIEKVDVLYESDVIVD